MKPNIQDFTIGMPDRLETIDVKAGGLMIGSSFPIRLQTMTTTVRINPGNYADKKKFE
jgi:4-hydroxy-3-methylbut-2-en-1-yl diphosphate synthase IspG/GcpE